MNKDKKILIIGAGISGLTTAVCLKEKGFQVVIVAEKFSPNLVSNVAGALWEWPPAACGKHGTPRSLERSKVWCMVSYQRFKALQSEYGGESTGVYLRNATFYFHDVLDDLPEDLNKMHELAGRVDNFKRGLDIISDTINLDSRQNIKDAYRHMAPMVDTDVYMQWLLARVRDLGCEIIQQKISVNLIEHEQTFLDQFQCEAIVNCTGLGSIEVANDASMYPLRGALVRVKDEQGVIDGAHCISHKETSNSEQDIVFIVPRGDKKTVILGGLVQIHQWEQSMSLNDPIIKRMYHGCLEFLPPLQSLPLDDQQSVRTGLRPFTHTNVCVEHVPATRLFYNYGHGGAGVTLSWGCAQETVDNIQALLQQENQQNIIAANTIDNQKQTVFLLQHRTPINLDLKFVRDSKCNLVLLCSRQGLNQITPSQFEHFNHVQIITDYDLLHLLESFGKIKTSFGLDARRCRIVTNDNRTMLIAAEMREALGLTGDKPNMIRPLIYKPELEKQVKGERYNISVITINGRIAYFAPCKHVHAFNQAAPENTMGYLVTRKQDVEYPILFNFLEQTLNNLAIGYPPNRMINFELALDATNNEPVLLEINAHIPNTLISKLFERHHGIALNEWNLRLQMGDLQKPIVKKQVQQQYSALCIYPKKAGIIRAIKKPQFESTTEVFWRIYPGQELLVSKSVDDYALAVLLSNSDWGSLTQDLETARSQNYYSVTP